MLDQKVVAFQRSSKWGLADLTGKILIPPTWDTLGSNYNSTQTLYPFPFSFFTKGLLFVASKDTSGLPKYGAINARGDVSINHGLIPFSIERSNRKRSIADEKKKEAATRKAHPIWPAPPMPRLEKLLASLKKANNGNKDARAILATALPRLEKMNTIKFPEKGEARIIELRSGPHLHGALVMVCAKTADLCTTECPRGLAIKEDKGDLGVKEISAEVFAGTAHRVAFGPEFTTTRALFVRYDLAKGSECAKGKMGEWGDSAERALLLKVAKQRMVPYRTLTMYNREVKRKITWHKGKDGTWYMGIATTYDHDPNAGQTPKLEVSLLVIPQKGYWQSKKGKSVDALRKTEPALKGLP